MMLLTYGDPELTLNTFLPMKDPSKPDGEAVNADGSLKDANQIQWVMSEISGLPYKADKAGNPVSRS
jgi:hypothetical protein